MSRGSQITPTDLAFLETGIKTPSGPKGPGDVLLTPMPPPPTSLTGAPGSTELELATMITAGHKQEECARAFKGTNEI